MFRPLKLLGGRAHELYNKLSVCDTADYEELKDALLQNFVMTEHNFDMTERKLERSFAIICRKSWKRLYSLLVISIQVVKNGKDWGIL